jgi:raffinose/stachyose/melibiose transport system substrate-binding protein
LTVDNKIKEEVMKKLILLAAVLSFAFGLFACEEGEDLPELILYQNKVEIDDVLSAYADEWGTENDVKVTVKTCGGDACGYADQIITEFQAAQQPDIFVIEGLGQYNEYQNKILDLTGEAWTSDTDVELVVDGKVYGFPINLEAWGMAYNKDILDAAGVDPDTLVNVEAYRTAFQQIEDAEIEGLETVVSWTAAAGMYWTTGLHNFNGYLASGLEYDDRTVIDNLLNGVADVERLEALADWVEVLMDFTDETLLTEGTYDNQINEFKLGRAAFLHQGNWVDPNLLQGDGIDFPVGYAPHASGLGDVDSIFIGAPSYYVINKDGDNIDLAKQFLNDMASTTEGHEYMVNEANFVPAFNSVTLVPSSPLSAVVVDWAKDGKLYPWFQNDMPPGFGMDELGPIYEQFAQGALTKQQFIDALKAEIETLAPAE